MTKKNDALIATYVPSITTTRWMEMRDLVRTATTSYAAGRSAEAVRLALGALAGFFDWALQLGILRAPLTDPALDTDVIDAYAAYRRTEVRTHVAERERKLLLALAGAAPLPETRAFGTTSPADAPYTAKETTLIRIWGAYQSTPLRQRNAAAIASLGLGCGLTSTEMLHVRGKDLVTLDDAHAGVVVTSERSRTVPALDEWAPWLDELRAEVRPSDWLIAPDRPLRPSTTIRSVTAGTVGVLWPTPQRMRNTWLVNHLNAGTPIHPLMRAAGFTDTSFIRRLLPFAAELSRAEELSLLRTGGHHA